MSSWRGGGRARDARRPDFWGVGVFQNNDFPHRGAAPGSSAPWATWLALIGFVGLCQLAGAVASTVTTPNVATWYLSLTRPPGTPPNWLFAPVWATLYTLIGVAGWLVWRRPGHRRPLLLWGWQLLVASFWTPAFFGLHSPPLGMAVICLMLVLIGLTIRTFARIRPLAAWLMLPYLLWTCYATYLNAGFWWLNPA